MKKMIVSWPSNVKLVKYHPETQRGLVEFETPLSLKVFTKGLMTRMYDCKKTTIKDKSLQDLPNVIVLVDKSVSYDVDECVDKIGHTDAVEILNRPLLGLFEMIPEAFGSGRPSMGTCVDVMFRLLEREKKDWRIDCAVRDLCRIVLTGEAVRISKWTPTFAAILPDVDEDELDDEGILFEPADYYILG
jgi:hypothetical protein